jgi:hypothetical protein
MNALNVLISFYDTYHCVQAITIQTITAKFDWLTFSANMLVHNIGRILHVMLSVISNAEHKFVRIISTSHVKYYMRFRIRSVWILYFSWAKLAWNHTRRNIFIQTLYMLILWSTWYARSGIVKDLCGLHLSVICVEDHDHIREWLFH